jgi:hypothetical protein
MPFDTEHPLYLLVVWYAPKRLRRDTVYQTTTSMPHRGRARAIIPSNHRQGITSLISSRSS